MVIAMDHSPGFLRLVEEAKSKVTEVTVEEVRERLARGETVLLVDVREDHEWAAGHARGSRHIGRGVLERDIEKMVPESNTELVLYCGGGYRSALAAESLGRMGYTRVRSLAGGWRAWLSAGGEVQKE